MARKYIESPTCEHLKADGTRCDAYALKGEKLCFYHLRAYRDTAPTDAGFRFPLLEDRTAIQLAIMQVMNAYLAGKLTDKKAGVLFYGLQLASSNAKQDIGPNKYRSSTDLTGFMSTLMQMKSTGLLDPESEEICGNGRPRPFKRSEAPQEPVPSTCPRPLRATQGTTTAPRSNETVTPAHTLDCHADSERSGEEIPLPQPEPSATAAPDIPSVGMSATADSASLRTPRDASNARAANQPEAAENVNLTRSLDCHANSERSEEEVPLPSPKPPSTRLLQRWVHLNHQAPNKRAKLTAYQNHTHSTFATEAEELAAFLAWLPTAPKFDPVDYDVVETFREPEEYMPKESHLLAVERLYNDHINPPKPGAQFAEADLKALFKELTSA